MIIAVFGIVAFAYDSIEKKAVFISRPMIITVFIAIAFSLWCFYSITVNGTDDTTYSNYWLSFATWLGGGYGVCFLIRRLTGSCKLEKLTTYLAAISLAQCIIAILIDNIPAWRDTVDSLIIQEQDLMHRIDRLYGIGALLDTAGCRFSVILVLMAHQMSTNNRVIDNIGLSLFYFLSFAVIILVGSIISRTTWVGAIIALVYLIVSFMRVKGAYLSRQQITFWIEFLSITLLSILICSWLYNSNTDFRQNFRFGFEGFFNWVETGVFRTDSTDKLNRIMWVWPKDTRSWIIGTGWFDNWYYHTDIGYCRFILYCGLIGMALFSIFFIYNGIAINYYLKNVKILSLFLIALTFIIWLKVSTDIFFIYALLFCLDPEEQTETLCTSSTT